MTTHAVGSPDDAVLDDAAPGVAPGGVPPGGAPGEADSSGAAGETYELLHALLHTVRREAADRFEEVGATLGQIRLLRALQHAGGPRRLGELAVALAVAPRSITAKVDQAEADGQVRRVPDPHDRRATLVELTPGGLEVLARVSAERSVGLGERLSRLSDEERRQLLRMLRTLAEPCAR